MTMKPSSFNITVDYTITFLPLVCFLETIQPDRTAFFRNEVFELADSRDEKKTRLVGPCQFLTFLIHSMSMTVCR